MIRPIGLIALCLALCLALCPAGYAAASRFTLQPAFAGALEPPVDRLSAEVLSLTSVVARADETSLDIRVDAAREIAFAVRVDWGEGSPTLTGDLLPGVVMLDELSGLKELALRVSRALSGARGAYGARRVSGAALADVLTGAARYLRARAALCRAQTTQACRGCGACEACRLADVPEAAARVLLAYAERFALRDDETVLVVAWTPDAWTGAPAASSCLRSASDQVPALLVRTAFERWVAACLKTAP